MPYIKKEQREELEFVVEALKEATVRFFDIIVRRPLLFRIDGKAIFEMITEPP